MVLLFGVPTYYYYRIAPARSPVTTVYIHEKNGKNAFDHDELIKLKQAGVNLDELEDRVKTRGHKVETVGKEQENKSTKSASSKDAHQQEKYEFDQPTLGATVAGAASSVVTTVQTKAHEAKEKVDETINQTKDKASQLKEAVKDKAAELKKKAEDKVAQGKDKLSEKFEDTKKSA